MALQSSEKPLPVNSGLESYKIQAGTKKSSSISKMKYSRSGSDIAKIGDKIYS